MVDFAYVVCSDSIKIKFFGSTDVIVVKSLREAEEKLSQIILTKNRQEKIKEILDEKEKI